MFDIADAKAGTDLCYSYIVQLKKMFFRFWGRLFTIEPYYTNAKISSLTKRALDEIQVTIIYSRAILVAVTSECSVKMVIYKTCTGTFRILANSADSYTERGV